MKMSNEYTNFWYEVLLWAITTLILGIFIALTFFAFNGDWNHLTSFEYWTSTVSTTALASFLRLIWAQKGLTNELSKNAEIKEKEKGKAKAVIDINSNNLTDVLQEAIDKANKQEKLKQYRNKCDRKIRKYSGKKWFRKRLEYWKNERIECDKDDFNVDVVRVKYYKYDIDSMLATTFRPKHDVETRGNLGNKFAKSYRITLITFLTFAILGALQVFLKDYSDEDLFVLLGRIVTFLININSGLGLGRDFVKSDYNNDLTKDLVFIKGVLKENGIGV